MPLLAFLGPLTCAFRVVTAFFMLALLIFPAAAETPSPPISGSNGLMGLWGANSSAPQTAGSNDQDGATGTPTESSPPSADAQDADLGSSPRSAPRNVVPPPISGSNGLMGEWGQNSSQPHGGSSGKPISGSNDLQGTSAPGPLTESSPPSAEAQDAELKSSPPDRVESAKPATKCRPFGQFSSQFQWTDRVELEIADGLQWKADRGFKRPTGQQCSWPSHRVESTECGGAEVDSTG